MNRYIAFLKVFERNSFSDAARDLGDISNIGRERHDERLLRLRAARGNHLVSDLRVGAEG